MVRTGTCQSTGEFELQIPLPNGIGAVNAACRYNHDGVSVWPACNGPVTYLHTRNTGTQIAWALLPDKKKGNPWVRLDPGDDITTTNPTQLFNLGLADALDVQSVRLSFVDPA